MPEVNGPQQQTTARTADAFSEGGLRAPAHYGPLRKLWWWFDFLILVKLARLRFIAVLVAVGAVIAYWDTLHAYYDKWTRPAPEHAAAGSDVEWWCPMHPTIVRDAPDKCPICGMPLSRRKKGDHADEEPLPPGVVSRVQLTPYRVALAGIQTAEVGYQPLAREITTVGTVEFDERKLARIAVRLAGKSRLEKLYVSVTGQSVAKGDPLALVYNPDLVTTLQNLRDARQNGNKDLERIARERLRLWGIEEEQVKEALADGGDGTHLVIRSPISGHVIRKYQVEGDYVEEGSRLYDLADLSTVWIEAQVYEDDVGLLREGTPVSATTRAFPNREFSGTLAFLQPHLDASTRTLRVRFNIDNAGHDLRPGAYATVTLKVPVAALGAITNSRAEDWRDQTAADLVAHALATPGGAQPGAGLASLARAAVEQAVAARGLALAVAERAVIDTGSRKLVYREAEPGVFEGVEVQLGHRCGGFYPVVRGLQPGDRVANSGSFLIDAETRLTAGASATYFGSSAGPQADHRSATTAARPSMTADEDTAAQAGLAKLGAADRRVAEAQTFCPILGTRLGAMGRPVKLTLKGETVFLCCKGCETKARANEEQTLKKVADLKVGKGAPAQGAGPGGDQPPASTTPTAGLSAKAKANLDKLDPEDRKLAEAQRLCPMSGESLGSMGKPVKLTVKGQVVFVCCKGCMDDALADPDKTLGKVKEFQSQNRQPRK
jgi:Cu(I)/Ag(I) efflux system membrane fusion protein